MMNTRGGRKKDMNTSDLEARTSAILVSVNQRSDMVSSSCAHDVTLDMVERLIRSMSGRRLQYIKVTVTGLYEWPDSDEEEQT